MKEERIVEEQQAEIDLAKTARVERVVAACKAEEDGANMSKEGKYICLSIHIIIY